MVIEKSIDNNRFDLPSYKNGAIKNSPIMKSHFNSAKSIKGNPTV